MKLWCVSPVSLLVSAKSRCVPTHLEKLSTNKKQLERTQPHTHPCAAPLAAVCWWVLVVSSCPAHQLLVEGAAEGGGDPWVLFHPFGCFKSYPAAASNCICVNCCGGFFFWKHNILHKFVTDCSRRQGCSCRCRSNSMLHSYCQMDYYYRRSFTND